MKEINSIVKRSIYEVGAYVENVGTVKRRVIVFENKTDKETDIYVALTGKYNGLYLKAETVKDGQEVNLPNAVYKTVVYENSNVFDVNKQMHELMCEKQYID